MTPAPWIAPSSRPWRVVDPVDQIAEGGGVAHVAGQVFHARARGAHAVEARAHLARAQQLAALALHAGRGELAARAPALRRSVRPQLARVGSAAVSGSSSASAGVRPTSTSVGW